MATDFSYWAKTQCICGALTSFG